MSWWKCKCCLKCGHCLEGPSSYTVTFTGVTACPGVIGTINGSYNVSLFSQSGNLCAWRLLNAFSLTVNGPTHSFSIFLMLSYFQSTASHGVTVITQNVAGFPTQSTFHTMLESVPIPIDNCNLIGQAFPAASYECGDALSPQLRAIATGGTVEISE